MSCCCIAKTCSINEIGLELMVRSPDTLAAGRNFCPCGSSTVAMTLKERCEPEASRASYKVTSSLFASSNRRGYSTCDSGDLSIPNWTTNAGEFSFLTYEFSGSISEFARSWARVKRFVCYLLGFM